MTLRVAALHSTLCCADHLASLFYVLRAVIDPVFGFVELRKITVK